MGLAHLIEMFDTLSIYISSNNGGVFADESLGNICSIPSSAADLLYGLDETL